MVETVGEPALVAPRRDGTPDADAVDQLIEETFQVDGEPVEVAIRAEETTIAYASGSERSVPTDALRFCPDCAQQGRYPLSEDGGPCPEHDAPLLPFDVEDYERFKLMHHYPNFGLQR